MENLVDQIIKFNKMIKNPSVSGITLKDLRAEINTFLRSVGQDQLRELFINLVIEGEMGNMFNLITDYMTVSTIFLLNLELKMIDTALHRKYENGLKRVLTRKEKEEMWMQITTLKV